MSVVSVTGFYTQDEPKPGRQNHTANQTVKFTVDALMQQTVNFNPGKCFAIFKHIVSMGYSNLFWLITLELSNFTVT